MTENWQQMKFTVDDAIPYLRGVLEPFGTVEYLPGKNITRQDLLDTDAMIIRTRTKCDESLLAGTPVKFIASATIGMDHVDLEAMKRLGIHFVNAPGCNAMSVAQYFASVVINEARRTKSNLAEKTLGIIGVGHVGTKVESVARALGMNILRNDPPRQKAEGSSQFVSLETVLQEADYITLHVPLDENSEYRTYHLADEEFFNSLAKKPFFINASRGEVVDSNALKAALITHRISGAALDVWEDEPEIDRTLLNLVRYATPHIAGYSADGKANGTAMSIRALAEFFNIEALKHFTVENVPVPGETELTLPCDDAVGTAVLTTYDVLRDDHILRESPDTFEKQRSCYPLRREFAAYKIKNCIEINEPDLEVLQLLGFQTQ